MKKTLILSALAVVAIAASCTKEMTPAQEKSSIQTLSQTFTATREALIDNETKASFEGTSLQWEEGDSIMISDGTATSKFIATKVEEGVATFKLKAGETPLAEGATYKAYYPTYLAPVDGVINVPQQQKTANGPTPEGKKINYAPSIFKDIPMYCESTTTELQFKNLCAVVKITLSTPGTEGDTAFDQIIAQTDSKPLFGAAKIEDGKLVITQEGEGYGRIAVKNTNAKWLSYVSEYYLSLPVGEYEDFEFIPETNKDLTQVRCLKAGSKLTLERNKVYTYDLAADDLRDDLSYARTTANCYVAVGAGKKMFRATKGNETSIIPGITKVGLVWRGQSSSSTDLTDKVVKDEITYKNGYVLFETTTNQGNAVIAAYDSNDKVLWSWHIWVLSSDRPLKDVVLGDKTFLDRNLGALYSNVYASGNYETSILTAGLLYQWGRKDPFGGKGGIKTEAAIKMLDINNKDCKSTSAGPVTMQESVEAPTTFYTKDSGHWASDIADSWGGEAKTIYDPCPYGYRVPAKADFEGFWNSDNVKVYESAYNASNTVVQGYNCTVGGVTSFFAVTGQLNNRTAALGGSFASSSQTTAATSKIEAYSRVFTRDSEHTFVDAVTTISKNKKWDDRVYTIRFSSSTNPYGMAVRCVKETTK